PSAKGDDKFITTDYLQQCLANGLNVREAATRLKVSKTALYTALQSTSAADS
ncbi:recombinase family protein, partial [Escherichia coli]|nr:recombinase family protein [Escherichia coli]